MDQLFNTVHANRTMRSISIFAVGLLLLCCTACNAPGERAASAEPRRDASADLGALKLSEACADAAEKFWRRGGYDKPSPAAPGQTETWSYTSHYNTQAKKCYVAVRLYTLMPSGGSAISEEVSDAAEGVLIASLHSYAKATEQLKPDFLNRVVDGGTLQMEPITTESLARFRRLMKD